MRRKKLIIAIDGPAGTGKSTAGRLLAKELDYIYVDSGAIYRALALKAVQQKIDLEQENELTELTKNTKFEFQKKNNEFRLFVDGKEVSIDIRTQEIGQVASKISAMKGVREGLLEIQRLLGKNGGIVMDGRDIGTVVFPDADVKLYLDATLEERSKRRFLEERKKGSRVSKKEVIEEIKKRDHNDSKRAIAPLLKAEDAIYLDTSNLLPEEVREILLKYCRRKLKK
ncbi:MAG: cytidylate kinase [Candidatus Schekmanbacteria bacterium RBG_16_38_11]|uniref:Cytidylate kinase n=1 Tax=Candidatus Schekmanbacteria bacterium RBG_16_38_11 TaxID=1817880 RepID=A0A1F7RZQ0_9BACT|nr:MAG: cytidylate kinase [Candidatus Schekmanbacteria bacterium RBG_16_38_11]